MRRSSTLSNSIHVRLLPILVACAFLACVSVLLRSLVLVLWSHRGAWHTSSVSTELQSLAFGGSATYAAVCTIVKDQKEDIREFIDYHRWIGFTKFYIYDNNSTHDLRSVLADYIGRGVVEHVVVHGVKGKDFQGTPQALAYQSCIDSNRHRHTWLAFIDVDEFLLIRDQDPSKQNINAFLKGYEGHGGLVVHWLMFGSSGHDKRPTGSVLTSYTNCIAKGSNHLKTIVNTRYVTTIGPTPHAFSYPVDHPAVNEKLQPIIKAKGNFTGDSIVLLHYVLKSKQDFQSKITRGGGARKGKNWRFFRAMDKSANDTCTLAVEKGRQFEACCFNKSATETAQHGDALNRENLLHRTALTMQN